MAHGGRIALCGASAQYAGEQATGANLGQVLARTLSLHGFVLYQHLAGFEAISQQLCAGVRSGQLQAREDLVYGLSNAPAALLRLFQGSNLGKQLIVLEQAAELEANLTV
jgi:NADPH-dependent curcumin reductase CurA